MSCVIECKCFNLSCESLLMRVFAFKFEVLFKLDTELIRTVSFESSETTSGRCHRVASIRDLIRIVYSDTMSQTIDVLAKIFAPDVVVRPASTPIEFGTCLVGQERCQQLVIKNPSFSSFVWSLRIGKAF